MNRSGIMKEAHRIARIYRGEVPYRTALGWGLRQAWAFAKGVAETEARMRQRQAVEGQGVTALRARIMAIQTQDQMSVADFATVGELHHQVSELLAA